MLINSIHRKEFTGHLLVHQKIDSVSLIQGKSRDDLQDKLKHEDVYTEKFCWIVMQTGKLLTCWNLLRWCICLDLSHDYNNV